MWSGYLLRHVSSVKVCMHKTFDLFNLNLLFTGQILQQGFYAWKSSLEITACFAKFIVLPYKVSFSKNAILTRSLFTY